MRGGVELAKSDDRDEIESELAYLITVARLAEVHGLWVGDGPHAVSIVAIDPS